MRAVLRAGVLGLTVTVALACSEEKSSYTYEGCENRDGVCSRDITLACAVNLIDERHSSCTVDADCIEPRQYPEECIPVTFCRKRLVNALEEEAYFTEVGVEILRYCEALNCGWASSDACAGPPGETPACVEGQCKWVTAEGS